MGKLISRSMILSLFISQLVLWVACNNSHYELRHPSFSSTTSSTSSSKLADQQPLCQETQRAALLEFYKDGIYNFGFDGSSTWFQQGTSGPTRDCCDWDEVFCDASGLVVSLSIDTSYSKEIHLNTSVPPWPIPLAKLHALQNLELYGLHFLRPIPSEMSLLPQTLSRLSIRYSYLRPPLLMPWAALSNLSSLTNLTFSMLEQGDSIAVLSWELCNLTHLQHLELSSIGFGGSIPSCLSSLSSLSYLDLSSNHLNRLPQYWNASSPLLYLDLHDNELEGPIYDGLLGQDIQYLALNNNNLTGSIPEAIGNLTKLTHLLMAHNQFLGALPQEWGKLSNLADLDLSYNQLHGRIAVSLGHNLTSLERLILSYNHLEGTIPPWLWSRPQLRQIDLSMNLLNGEVSLDGLCSLVGNGFVEFIAFNNSLDRFFSDKSPSDYPDQCSSFSRMALDLHSNNLSGVVPWDFLVVNNRILNLNLSDNSLFGEFPEMTHLTTLNTLDLSHNLLSGSIPYWLSDSSGLISVQLSFNQFSGQIPVNICGFSLIQKKLSLKLAHNYLSGLIPDELGQYCTGLVSLVLANNELTGPIPSALSNLSSSLVVLDLSHNHLTGEIPSWIQQMHSLRVLSFSFNGLSGPLPRTPWNNTQLQVLHLSNNNLTGTISAQSLSLLQGFHYNSSQSRSSSDNILYDDSVTIEGKGQELQFVYLLTATVSLDLSNNILTGHIPPELGSLDGLVFFNLSNNHLTGRIPESLGSLRQLSSLDVSRNDLEGEISQNAFCLLTFLSIVDVSYNNLTGSIPQCNQWGTFPEKSFIGNKGLCGPPLALPCPSISSSSSSSSRGGPAAEKQEATDYDFLLGIIVSFCISFPVVFAVSLFWFPLNHQIFKASQWIHGRL